MSKKIKCRPDYAALYPGVDIPADVLAVLKKSDRKMEYMEYDLKRELPVKNDAGSVVGFLPSREDSYERLVEAYRQFEDDSADPERILMETADTDALYCCLAMLDADERSLITALFFDGVTVRKYAAANGLSKSKVDRTKKRVLGKLKNLLLNFGF